MVNRGVVLAIVLAAAAPARGDSPRLAQARQAVAAVDYDEARRLLVEALHDGGNSPAAVGEIYRLSARAAVVQGQRELAEQYYRRWLAIDPDAALPGDAAPKLREPFVAAQAYIAAHGRLLARAQRTATGELDVELISDPLVMARAAAVVDPLDARSSAVGFGSEHHVRLGAGERVAILDENGNHLLELGVAAAAPSDVPLRAAVAPAPETRPWPRRWLTWAIPTGAFTLVGAGFGIAAIASYGRAHMIASASGQYFLSDADENVRRGRTFTWITAGAGGLAIACAIPTVVYLVQQRREARRTVMPTAGDGTIGLVVAGRF
jgi:hypothetical protein